MAMTVLGFGGMFATFTYIAPMMTEVAGFSSGAVTWLLVLFGTRPGRSATWSAGGWPTGR